MRIFGAYFTQIQLAEGDQVLPDGLERIHLLRVGKFKHKIFGPFEITKETLVALKENFDNNVRQIEVAVDYFHETQGIASGWIKKVEISEDGLDLWVDIEWTKTARQKIEEKELRYISADFDFNYENTETGIKHGPVLLGAGLTNRPHIKNMRAILGEEFSEEQIAEMKLLLTENQQGELTMDFEQILEAIKGLSPDQKAQIMSLVKQGDMVSAADVTELKEENAVKLSELNIKLTESVETIKGLESKITEGTKTSKFNLMLSEGKAVEAQREHYLSGDMDKFVESSKKLHLSEDGSGAGAGDQTQELTVEKANEELNSQAVKLSEAKGIDYGEALSQVMDKKENKKYTEKLD